MTVLPEGLPQRCAADEGLHRQERLRPGWRRLAAVAVTVDASGSCLGIHARPHGRRVEHEPYSRQHPRQHQVIEKPVVQDQLRLTLVASRWLVKDAKSGDCLFMHYSGHGGSMKDDNGDEADGMDETMVPVDYARYTLVPPTSEIVSWKQYWADSRRPYLPGARCSPAAGL